MCLELPDRDIKPAVSSTGLGLGERFLDGDGNFRMASVQVAVKAMGAIMSEKWMAKKGVTAEAQGSQLM